MRTLAWRLVAGGLLLALAVAASGGAIERARFGSTDDEALARVEAELRRQFDTSARALGDLAAAVRADSSVIRAALRDRTEARRLFDIVSTALAQQQAGPTGVTVYDASNRPLAWAGRVSDLAKQLVSGPPSLVMVPGALGPRLVRVEPVEDAEHHDLARAATIVVEQSMATLQQAPGLADTAVLATSLVPATHSHARHGSRNSRGSTTRDWQLRVHDPCAGRRCTRRRRGLAGRPGGGTSRLAQQNDRGEPHCARRRAADLHWAGTRSATADAVECAVPDGHGDHRDDPDCRAVHPAHRP